MKTKQEIMQEILSQMTGDAIKDLETIADVLEENKDHPEIEEIGFELLARITERIPNKAKEEMARLLEENHKNVENQLAEVDYLLEDKQYHKALETIEKLFKCFELLQMFDEENIFQFYTFSDGLQESVYRVMHNMQAPTGNAPENYGKAYALYGKALLCLQREEEAKEKYNQAIRWNPMDISSYIALAQIAKLQYRITEMKECLKKAFRYAYKKEDIGDIYIFLTGYYIEQEEYEVAYNCAFFASFFTRKSRAEKYIKMVREACPYHLEQAQPDRLSQIFDEYEIEKIPSEEMIQVLYSIANYCEQNNRFRESLFVWNAIYDLLEDKDSITKIDALEDCILDEFGKLIQDYMDNPCDRKFKRLLFELKKLHVYAALRNDTKDEYAIVNRDGQTYFALFTRKEIDPALLLEYKGVKVPVEQVIHWAKNTEEDIDGLIFNPDEDGMTLDLDELSSLVQNEYMS